MLDEPCGCKWDERANPIGRAGLVSECAYHARAEQHALDLARELRETRAALAAATERAERLDRLHEEALASLSRAVDCVAEQRRRADALAARLAEVEGRT